MQKMKETNKKIFKISYILTFLKQTEKNGAINNSNIYNNDKDNKDNKDNDNNDYKLY